MKFKNMNPSRRLEDFNFEASEVLSRIELQSVVGGFSDMWELLQYVWNNTPEGTNSSWTNIGGNWIGTQNVEVQSLTDLYGTIGGGGGGGSLPNVLVNNLGHTLFSSYEDAFGRHSTLIFGKSSAISFLNSMEDPLGIGSSPALNFLASILGATPTVLGQMLGFAAIFSSARTLAISNLINAIQNNPSGNIEVRISHIYSGGGSPYGGIPQFGFYDVNTGNLIGIFAG